MYGYLHLAHWLDRGAITLSIQMHIFSSTLRGLREAGMATYLQNLPQCGNAVSSLTMVPTQCQPQFLFQRIVSFPSRFYKHQNSH
jgi:hypothetical protein